MAESLPNSNDKDTENEEEKNTSVLQKEHQDTSAITQILTAQIMHHCEGIKDVETRLKELLGLQEECIRSLAEDNAQFSDVKKIFNFNVMFEQISFYTKKLNHLHNSMTTIEDRVTRLKHRSKTIKDHLERKAREKREAKAREEELERLLTAKPIWEVDNQPLQRKET